MTLVWDVECGAPDGLLVPLTEGDAIPALQRIDSFSLTRQGDLEDLFAVPPPLELVSIENQCAVNLPGTGVGVAIALLTSVLPLGYWDGLGVEGEADTEESLREDASRVLLGRVIHDGQILREELELREADCGRPLLVVPRAVLIDPDLVITPALQTLRDGIEAQTHRGRGNMRLDQAMLELHGLNGFIGTEAHVYGVAVTGGEGDDVEAVGEAREAMGLEDAPSDDVDVETYGEQDGVEEGVVLHAVAAATGPLGVEDELVEHIVGVNINGAVP